MATGEAKIRTFHIEHAVIHVNVKMAALGFGDLDVEKLGTSIDQLVEFHRKITCEYTHNFKIFTYISQGLSNDKNIMQINEKKMLSVSF